MKLLSLWIKRYIKAECALLTRMSLWSVWISVENSTHCSSNCWRFCILLEIWSFSPRISFTLLLKAWICSCWSWISFLFSSILLQATQKEQINKHQLNTVLINVRTDFTLNTLWSWQVLWCDNNTCSFYDLWIEGPIIFSFIKIFTANNYLKN